MLGPRWLFNSLICGWFSGSHDLHTYIGVFWKLLFYCGEQRKVLFVKNYVWILEIYRHIRRLKNSLCPPQCFFTIERCNWKGHPEISMQVRSEKRKPINFLSRDEPLTYNIREFFGFSSYYIIHEIFSSSSDHFYRPLGTLEGFSAIMLGEILPLVVNN